MGTENLPKEELSLLCSNNKDAIDLTTWWLIDTILEIKKAAALGNLRGNSKQCSLLVVQLEELLHYKLKKQGLTTGLFGIFIKSMKKKSICPNSICSNVEKFYEEIKEEMEFKQEKNFKKNGKK